MTIAIIVLLALILFVLVAILDTLKKRPVPPTFPKIELPKIEFPKMEMPKIELPPIEIPKIEVPKIELPKIEFPKVEVPKIELPKIELPKIEFPKIEIPPVEIINAEVLQEIVTLMRVNQAEFQSGLETFHKAIDKLLAQIPNGERELNTQKEFMQKFEEAMRKAQESAAEAMNENSLRLQEILAEVLNKEAK